MKIRCMNCMKEYEDEYEICPNCGYIRGTKPKESYHLRPETILHDKYEIGTVIGFGGFGVIYKAWDKNLKKIVAIKEYYPTAFLNRIPGENSVRIYDKKNLEAFEKGKKEFLEEARNLAKFNSHPNIVHVFDFFEENGTAYFVMEYLDGCSLKVFLQANREKKKTMSVDTALQITQAVLSGLKAIHEKKIIHRDIKPGNIFLCKDGTIKLIDFGAARFASEDTEKTRTIIITPGYAPAEQYQTKSKQGAYTDIYAAGAVLYEILTGIKPEESINRKVEDNVEEPQKLKPEVPAYISKAVMKAMAIQPEIRFQTVDQFAKILNSKKEVRDVKKEIAFLKKRKIFRIAMLFMIVIGSGIFCGWQYSQRNTGIKLQPAAISVWIPYDESNGEEDAKQLLDEMTSEYLNNNEMISLDIQTISSSDYEYELKKALKNGTGPDVFDSSCLTAEDYDYLGDLTPLFKLSVFHPEDYFYLSDYRTYFPSGKQLPLSFELPVQYTNILEDVTGAEETGNSKTKFLAGEIKEYLGSTDDYAEIQQQLAGRYEMSFPDNTDESKGSFKNLWSISGEIDTKKQDAAILLLYYLLSETSEDYLTVQNTNHLPLNKNVMTVFVEVNRDFEGIEKYIEQVQMSVME